MVNVPLTFTISPDYESEQKISFTARIQYLDKYLVVLLVAESKRKVKWQHSTINQMISLPDTNTDV